MYQSEGSAIAVKGRLAVWHQGCPRECVCCTLPEKARLPLGIQDSSLEEVNV